MNHNVAKGVYPKTIEAYAMNTNNFHTIYCFRIQSMCNPIGPHGTPPSCFTRSAFIIKFKIYLWHRRAAVVSLPSPSMHLDAAMQAEDSMSIPARRNQSRVYPKT